MNLMEDKQILKSQPKEDYEAEGETYARTYNTCKSTLITQRVLPSSASHHCMYICNNSDWEICEELRIRELEEAKARTAQMEKTMRWWSDCTANWREKWSKVRAERNKAREEGRQLKLKLEATMKELNALKKIKQHLLRENEEGETENIWEKNFDSSELCWMKDDHTRLLEKKHLKYAQNNKICNGDCIYQDICTTENTLEQQDIRIDLEMLNSEGICTTAVSLENPSRSKDHPTHSHEDEVMHISMLHLCLHESQKMLQKEQKIHSSLEKEVEKLKSEKSLWKRKYEELKISKEGSLKQLGIPDDLSQNEVERILDALEEETGARSQKDTIIQDLQAEVERLQSEKASEWGRRKILETEKQDLDRENRRLKTHVKDLQHLLERKNKLSAINCGDLQATQTELLGGNKDFMALQPNDSELKKREEDILAELMCTRKRVEQHKAEAKELSITVEDLRRKLKQTEDKV